MVGDGGRGSDSTSDEWRELHGYGVVVRILLVDGVSGGWMRQ